MSNFNLKAAVSDPDGGLEVNFSGASLTVQQAEVQLPRLTMLRAYTSMSIDQCRELINVSAPERARKQYQDARMGTKENA